MVLMHETARAGGLQIFPIPIFPLHNQLVASVTFFFFMPPAAGTNQMPIYCYAYSNSAQYRTDCTQVTRDI